jgi:putative intracellular protease/amidase
MTHPLTKHTLVILYPGCIEYEIVLAAQLLHPHFPVRTATPGGHAHAGFSGLILQGQLSYQQIVPAEVGVVLIPGGDPGSVLEHAPLQNALLALAQAPDIQWGAICAGPLLLARQGLLKGRSFTHGYGQPEPEPVRPFFADGFWLDQPLVEDGPFLTAQAPAQVDFALRLAVRCGVLSDEEAASQSRYFNKFQ